MSMKHELWQERFKAFPSWPCPRCAVGRLVEIDGTLINEETDGSKEAHGHEAWEPDWAEKRFTVHMRCSDKGCGERAVVAGTTKVEMDYDYDYNGQTVIELTDWFRPSAIIPSPPVIQIPDETPEAVNDEVRRASALLWLDAGSSANKLRSSAELLLTELGIARTTVRKGKRHPLPLATRIDQLAPSQPSAAELLHSIRWLGNVGTHEGVEKIDRMDLLSGFEIFEHVLEQLYDKKALRLAKAARAISKRKGKKTRHRGRGSLKKSIRV